jgi:hypothetical protein
MVKIFIFGWMVLACLAFAAYLTKPGSEYALAGIVSLIVIAVFFVMREWLRRKREGFYVSTRGNAEGGDVVYHEADRFLTFYFDREARTIYVPSNRKWEEQMPEWAKARRLEIMENIRKRLGKTWNFEDKAE